MLVEREQEKTLSTQQVWYDYAIDKLLEPDSKYRRSGERIGQVARIKRSTLAKLAHLPDDSAIHLTKLKLWAIEQRGVVLQPNITKRQGSGDGTFIITKDPHQRAADSLAATARHQGEKVLHVKQNMTVLANTQLGQVLEEVAWWHGQWLNRAKQAARDDGFDLSDDEIEAIIRSTS